MTEAEFTPGPWSAYIDEGACIIQSDSSGFAVADANKGSAHPLSDEWDKEWVAELDAQAEANAHLIAAAPDLYAALEAIISWDHQLDGPYAWEALEQAKAALAKARGEVL